MGYLRTFSGLKLDPFDPDEQNIRLEDIAHSLSQLCRLNGTMGEFYSIGRHDINCAMEAKARGQKSRLQLACLLHEASKAYLSDLPETVKSRLPQYVEVERRLQETIYKRFALPDLTSFEIKTVYEIEETMRYYETLHFMHEQTTLNVPSIADDPDYISLPFTEVEAEFLKIAGRMLIQIRLNHEGMI